VAAAEGAAAPLAATPANAPAAESRSSVGAFAAASAKGLEGATAAAIAWPEAADKCAVQASPLADAARGEAPPLAEELLGHGHVPREHDAALSLEAPSASKYLDEASVRPGHAQHISVMATSPPIQEVGAHAHEVGHRQPALSEQATPQPEQIEEVTEEEAKAVEQEVEEDKEHKEDAWSTEEKHGSQVNDVKTANDNMEEKEATEKTDERLEKHEEEVEEATKNDREIMAIKEEKVEHDRKKDEREEEGFVFLQLLAQKVKEGKLEDHEERIEASLQGGGREGVEQQPRRLSDRAAQFQSQGPVCWAWGSVVRQYTEEEEAAHEAHRRRIKEAWLRREWEREALSAEETAQRRWEAAEKRRRAAAEARFCGLAEKEARRFQEEELQRFEREQQKRWDEEMERQRRHREEEELQRFFEERETRKRLEAERRRSEEEKRAQRQREQEEDSRRLRGEWWWGCAPGRDIDLEKDLTASLGPDSAVVAERLNETEWLSLHRQFVEARERLQYSGASVAIVHEKVRSRPPEDAPQRRPYASRALPPKLFGS